MIRAIAAWILRQILPVIVGAEAFSPMQISALSRCGHVVGRPSVDVAADPPVDQRGLRPRLRAHKTSCRSCKKRVEAYAVALLRLISRKPHSGRWFARVPTAALWTPRVQIAHAVMDRWFDEL